MRVNDEGKVVLSPEQMDQVRIAIEQADRGETVTLEEAKAYVKRRMAEWLPESELSA